MGSWTCTADLESTYFSAEMFRLLGLPVEDVPPSTEAVGKAFAPADWARIRNLFETARRDKTAGNGEFSVILPDGANRPHVNRRIRLVADPVAGASGDIVQFVCVAIDVTELDELRRESEEALRLRELNFQLIVDSISVPVAVTTPAGEVEGLNRLTLEDFGRQLDELKGWQSSDAVHPDDLQYTIAAMVAAHQAGSAYNVESRHRRADGVYRWFNIRGFPLRDPQGQILRWFHLLIDIDDRKRAEERVRQSEADLIEAQRLSHTGSWKHDLASGVVTITPEVLRIFDIRPDEDASTADFFLSRIHPEDRPGEALNYERAAMTKADFESDYRVVLPDGSIKHIHNCGHPKLNEAGELVTFVGTVMDVTAAKLAEEKIRQSEWEARQLLDLSPLHITLLGPGGTRIYNNRAALDYYGLTLEEWRGADLQRLLHPLDAERGTNELSGRFQDGSPFDYEARLKGRDGQYRWFHYRLSPMLDEQGRITRWYCAGTDIHDRKSAEQRLLDENVSLREEIDKTSMFEEIVGTSAPLKSVVSRISKVAPTDSGVLITGETGTGKELVARAIHRRSQRSSYAFVSVNCAVIPRDLIASELFGHEKGAFTGAAQMRLGRFELASGGTLFLDEVGELACRDPDRRSCGFYKNANLSVSVELDPSAPMFG